MKRIFQIAFLSFFTATLSGCFTDNGTFPEPSANFTPKRVYAVSTDKLWSDILDTLDKNRITTTGLDKTSGVIQTDYIAGPGKFMVMMAQSTRYKYSVTLRDQADGTVRVNIICKVESSISSNAGSQWRDVTPQNAALTTKLETWLYEQIEQEIK